MCIKSLRFKHRHAYILAEVGICAYLRKKEEGYFCFKKQKSVYSVVHDFAIVDINYKRESFELKNCKSVGQASYIKKINFTFCLILYIYTGTYVHTYYYIRYIILVYNIRTFCIIKSTEALLIC